MTTTAKTYLVEDADQNPDPDSVRTPFPGTLRGLLDALDAARYRSAAGTPKVVVIAQGKERKIIRRYEHGDEVWSLAQAEVLHQGKDER